MGNPQGDFRQFRVNPVEIIIFTVVMMIFCNSVYNLFTDHSSASVNPTLLSKLDGGDSADRAPASNVSSFQPISLGCQAVVEQQAEASRVRIKGSFCGLGSPLDAAKQLSKLEVSNSAGNATVFPDLTSGTYSTDYISLASGKNAIRVQMTYKTGKVFTQVLNITKP